MRVARSILSSLFAGSLVVTLASACSDSSGDDGGGGGCKDFAADLCGKLESCYPVLIDLLYGDVAKCTERTELGCNEQIGAPGSNINSAKIAACGNAWSSASCESLTIESPEACNVPGSLADGEPCQFNSQCTSDNCRISTATSACGTCAPRSAAGGSCNEANGNDDCQDNLVCAAGVCATPVAAGGACTDSGQCASNLICKSGTCAVPDGAGAACTPGSCDFLKGLLCDPVASTCKSIQFAQAGEACGLISGNLVACAGQGTCNGATQTTPGTCAPAAADGAACNADNGPNCVDPAACINGSCQLPNPESCT